MVVAWSRWVGPSAGGAGQPLAGGVVVAGARRLALAASGVARAWLRAGGQLRAGGHGCGRGAVGVWALSPLPEAPRCGGAAVPPGRWAAWARPGATGRDWARLWPRPGGVPGDRPGVSWWPGLVRYPSAAGASRGGAVARGWVRLVGGRRCGWRGAADGGWCGDRCGGVVVARAGALNPGAAGGSLGGAWRGCGGHRAHGAEPGGRRLARGPSRVRRPSRDDRRARGGGRGRGGSPCGVVRCPATARSASAPARPPSGPPRAAPPTPWPGWRSRSACPVPPRAAR